MGASINSEKENRAGRRALGGSGLSEIQQQVARGGVAENQHFKPTGDKLILGPFSLKSLPHCFNLGHASSSAGSALLLASGSEACNSAPFSSSSSDSSNSASSSYTLYWTQACSVSYIWLVTQTLITEDACVGFVEEWSVQHKCRESPGLATAMGKKTCLA